MSEALEQEVQAREERSEARLNADTAALAQGVAPTEPFVGTSVD